MKKLLIAGAAFLLTAGMGTKALASGHGFFLPGTADPGAALCHNTHHMGTLTRKVGGSDCAAAGSFQEAGILAGTGVIHHIEPDEYCTDWIHDHDGGEGSCYTGDGCGTAADSDSWGSCHVVDGYCMSQTHANAEDLCDLCGNPICHESAGEGNGYGLSQNIGETALQDGDRVQQNGENLASQEDRAQQSGGSPASKEDRAQQSGVNPAVQEAGAVQADVSGQRQAGEAEKDGSSGNQTQNYSGYGSGHHGSGYGSCGSSGHHGSGHHGSSHH